ncbi:MAG: hypothetical protein HY959_09630 [Ignavibacteriae bacterium]|nr:hypothetical protein [Ignavibacteriota bacterium]
MKREQKEWLCKAKLEFEEQLPEWKIEKQRASKLLDMWNSLKTTLEPSKKKSAYLGYGGTYLKSSDNSEWHIFDKTVTRITDSTIETRVDVKRYFEKTILKSAPSGILPDALCSLLFGI